MIGFLLALALVVGCPSVGHVRPACIVVVVRHRALDLRSGGLPQPRAPDVEPALSRIG